MKAMDWRLFFSFRGRVNRAKFWLAVLVFFGAYLALAVISFVAHGTMTFHAFSELADLALFVSGLAVAAKRLHDRDRSAWWLLPFYVGPFVFILAGFGIMWATAGAVGTTLDTSLLAFRLCIVGGIAIGLWGFVEIGCLRGTAGYNRFGPDPLPRRLPRI